jgi:hypothetical protein
MSSVKFSGCFAKAAPESYKTVILSPAYLATRKPKLIPLGKLEPWEDNREEIPAQTDYLVGVIDQGGGLIPFVVVFWQGVFFIIDAGHRYRAAKKMWDVSHLIDCDVYYPRTKVEFENHFAILANNNRLKSIEVIGKYHCPATTMIEKLYATPEFEDSRLRVDLFARCLFAAVTGNSRNAATYKIQRVLDGLTTLMTPSMPTMAAQLMRDIHAIWRAGRGELDGAVYKSLLACFGEIYADMPSTGMPAATLAKFSAAKWDKAVRYVQAKMARRNTAGSSTHEPYKSWMRRLAR